MTFGARLMEWGMTAPDALPQMPFVLAQTLGKAWDSANLAALWGMMMTAPKAFRKNAARAGFAPGMDQGDRIFQAILDTPQGLWVGKADETNPMDGIKTPSGKIEVYIPEMEAEIKSLDSGKESAALALPAEFPLILNAGRHFKYNANTLMRNPEWNKGKRACTVSIHPEDARSLKLTDGQQVRVFTAAGSQVGELEVSAQIRQGTVLIPHGFGLIYGDEIYGINVNYLTKNTHRDPMGTPIHRFVPCRVEGV
jgi:anaerobic selenocysteine-containing dehydrogenase